MNQSENINDLAAAMAKAQAEIKPAIKDATNPHLKSKYADLASVWAAARDILGKHGLCVIQAPGKLEGNTLELTTRLLHQSGQWLESTISLPVVKLDAQTCGGAITYARRYSLSAMLGIVADDDDDGHSGTYGNGSRQQDQRGQERPFQPVSQPRPASAPESRGDAAAQPKLTEQSQGREPILYCSHQGCGVPLTKGQHDVSLRAFGQPLCPKHQKEQSTSPSDGNPTPGAFRLSAFGRNLAPYATSFGAASQADADRRHAVGVRPSASGPARDQPRHPA